MISFKLFQKGDAFIMPAFIVLFVIIIIPVFVSIFDSFIVQESGQTILCFRNYREIFDDPYFLRTVSNTFIFTFASVIFHLVIGMIVALLLNRPGKVFKVFQSIMLAPWTTSLVVVGLLWKWLYNIQYGIINEALLSMGFIKENLTFLVNPVLAMPSVLLANIWRGFPFIALMLLAGLQTVPKEQYEAAIVDGANSFKCFWYITIPNLHHIILVATLLDFIWNFRSFDLIKLMTDGGPGGTTEVMSTLVYRQMFNYMDFGTASALGVIMLIIVLIASFFYAKIIFKD